jgi:hypothetical protein
MKLTSEVRIESNNTGRLPRRSDIRPSIGENSTCIKEKEAINIPILEGVAPKLVA